MNMKSDIQRHLESALVTFVATFLTLIGTEIAVQDPTQWSKTVIISLIFAAIRGAFKVAYESLAGSNDVPTTPSPLNSTTVS
jgi:hypothetical protein